LFAHIIAWLYIILRFCVESKRAQSIGIKYWEIIADNLSEAGWSWGCVSAIDSQGRTIWIVDPHRDNGKRFVARADEKLTAFLELESGIRDVALLQHRKVETITEHSDRSQNWDCVLPAAAADVNFGTLLGEKFEATSRTKHPTVVTCMKKGTSKVQVFLQY